MRKFFFITSGILFTTVIVRVILSFVLGPSLVDGQRLDFTATILSEPTEKYGQLNFPVSLSNGWGSKTIYVTTPEGNFHYGDRVHIISDLKIKVLDTGRTIYTASSPTIAKDQNFLWSHSLGFFSAIRTRVQKIYSHAMGSNESSLLLGIVLGVKGTFSQDLLSAFRSTGVMHVIAASGMNVTLVAGFLVSILGRYFKRQYVGSVTIVALLTYCFIAGLQPSIVRATIMGSMGLMAQLYGRQNSGLYGLFLAGSGMLLLNPVLLQDIGFQLSFASSLGILLLHPHVSKIPLLGEDISTTVSAQIATLPILLMSFGQYGVLSILVNALLLWTVAPLMIIGGMSAIIGLVIFPIGVWISYLALPLLWYFEKVVGWFGKFPTLSVDSLPIVWVVGYYLLICSFIWIINTKAKSVQKDALKLT